MFRYGHRYHQTTPAAVSRTLFKLIDYTLGFSLPHSLSRSTPDISQRAAHPLHAYIVHRNNYILCFYPPPLPGLLIRYNNGSNGNKLCTFFNSEKSRLWFVVCACNKRSKRRYGNRWVWWWNNNIIIYT